MEIFRVYNSNYPMVRLGSDSDGGYVVADLNGYDVLFSCGISDDVSFENAFLEKHNVECFSYDGTIDSLPPLSHPSIKFQKLNIGSNNTALTTNLDAETSAYNNIFLKMDIESHEFRWINSLPDGFFLRFKQIVIEFHLPFTNQDYTSRGFDVDLAIKDKLSAIKKLTDTHTLIHLHANNCCGTTLYQRVQYPNVFECTFIRKDLQDGGVLNKARLPSNLDRPNRKGAPDITISWAPFVNK